MGRARNNTELRTLLRTHLDRPWLDHRRLYNLHTFGHALVVPGAFLAIAFVEGQLITPTIIGRRLALDPTAVFVWLLAWGWLWGIPGVLLAGPMIACFRIVCQHVEALKWIGALIGDGSSFDTETKK